MGGVKKFVRMKLAQFDVIAAQTVIYLKMKERVEVFRGFTTNNNQPVKILLLVREVWDSNTGQIRHSDANGLHRYDVSSELCCPAAAMGPATRYTLLRNTASIRNI